jgi:hypothetical protein
MIIAGLLLIAVIQIAQWNYRLKVPAMIFIDHPSAGEESHAVAYMGNHLDSAEIWDPLEGKRFVTSQQLKKIWHGRGIEFCLEKRQ